LKATEWNLIKPQKPLTSREELEFNIGVTNV